MPELAKENLTMGDNTDPKSAAFKKVFDKLSKRIAHFGNEVDTERHKALEDATKILREARLDWHDVLTLLAGEAPSIFELLAKFHERETDTLLRLGLAGASLYFCTSQGTAHADIPVAGHRETLPVAESEFGEWLLHLFFLERKTSPCNLGAEKCHSIIGCACKV
jgi:hypothetical protein